MNPPLETPSFTTVILVLSNLNTTATRPNILKESTQTSSVQGSPAVQKVELYLTVTAVAVGGVAAIINAATATAAKTLCL
jgi:hypothetical protein